MLLLHINLKNVIVSIIYAFSEDYEPPQSNTSNVTDIDEADDSLHDDNDITSGTVSSPDSSDHDLPDSLHDDSAEHIECRERRDSGVGSSLTRAPR